MIPAADPKRPPYEEIGPRGGRVWNMVTALHDDGTPVYVLRPDDLMNLERWCKAEDMIEDLERAIDAELGPRTRGKPRNFWKDGIAGTQVVNGLLAEWRTQNNNAAAYAKALRLPDATDAPGMVQGTVTSEQLGRPLTQSEHARNIANKRWHGSGATG